MSYIGQGLPADTFQGFVTDSFTGDGSATTFTLSKEPFSEDTLIVVINNVIQKPTTNFTVSGTTLTIVGTAVASGDVIYAIHMGGPLPIGGASELDLNGASDKLILDADGDTTISADTDDQIDFKAGGTDRMSVTSSGIDVTGAITASSASSINVTGGSALTLKSTDAGSSAGPVLKLQRDSASPADADFVGAITYIADNDAGEATDYAKIDLQIDDASDGSEDGQLFFRCMGGGTLSNRISIYGASTVINDDSRDADLRVETDAYASALVVDAGENAVFVGTTSFYDTNAILTARSGSSSNAIVHFSNNSGSYGGNGFRIAFDTDDSTSNNFEAFTDTNDTKFKVRGDGVIFADGGNSISSADFAEYFESTDGSAISIGKTVVLDNGKVRASTDSDSASDIVGVVRHRKTAGIIGNDAWSKWKGKYKVDDYGVPLLEEYTITEWDQIVAEDANDLEITYKGEKKKLKQIKGDTIHHSYATDKIPSELTVPGDAKVLTVDADGNKYKRKIFSDSFDASKEYVSREFRDEWNLIGLTGQVTMTKGQKTGDRWIKMRDISDTVEEWLIR